MKTRITDFFSSLSFRNKVMLISITCLILPAISTFTAYNYLTKDAVKEQAIISANNELKLKEEYLNKIFEDMLYILNFIQMDSELSHLLSDSGKNSDFYERFLNEKKIQKVLDTVTLLGQNSYVTIVLKDGKTYTNYSATDYDPKNLLEEEWIQDLNKVRGYHSTWLAPQPTMLKSEKKRSPFQISVARALRDGSTIYGYAMVTIPGYKITDILKGTDQEHGVILQNEEHIMVANYGEMAEQMNEEINHHVANIIKLNGNKYLINRYEVSIPKWELVSFIKYDKAVYSINSIFKKVFVVQNAAFILFLLLLTYLLRKVLNRLVYLKRIAQEVQKGNLSTRSKLAGTDEIGTLSTSFNQMLDKVNEMMEQNTRTESRKREAELAMLQAQINPHFLFNVLNSIRMKVLIKRDRESAEMIGSLSKLLRMTIDKNKGMISFHEELEINQDYVRLMNMRQKQKVDVHIEVSPYTYLIQIPRLILQPIIENAIIHGLNQSAGTVIIRAFIQNETFMIQIEDNGIGMDKQKIDVLNEQFKEIGWEQAEPMKKASGFSSIGLSNVYERMKLTFGEKFSMKIESELGKGSIVSMCIPIERSQNNV
ncbi:histidine kinase [Bacillus sp. FJAT-50079]|uniref:cache domain-containing sensor histidine kinase n=1 Tax=Bacillus sp. FJAT-50079 TaxID=2833577 RepID=UPI001BC984B1|nr:histidine kinase [Bacillus sp. FJAT-50079]MBS4210170.1 histidine kinase [Bacillus sp. FJAT-50079]